MAAALACGPGAVLSHRSAAALLGLSPDGRAVVDVTIPRGGARARPAIRIHRSGTLEAKDVASVEGIPCTSVARTLLDLAEDGDRRRLQRAVEQAEVLRVFDGREIDDVLARASGRTGAPLLRAVAAEFDPLTTLTRSELEKRVLDLCKRAGLPQPEVNAWLVLDGGHAFEVDFLWRDRRLVVEADSRRFHLTPQAFEKDRRRDQLLLIHGWRVARCTWRQVVSRADELGDTLAALCRAQASNEAVS
jgi:hypothetical protein